MSVEKLMFYYPNAKWSWTSEGDYSTLEWFGPGDKPTQGEFDALEWPTDAAVRATMRTTRAKFALASFAAGLITDAEAEAWAGGTSLPQIVTDAFTANITDAEQRLAARIEALTTAHIHRANPLIVMLQGALQLTDAQVDALFA